MPLDSDEGATAIIVGILTVVLFGLSALAVEITDMFSRDRAIQTTADLAAFAGAQDLPDTCAAFNGALTWLNDPENGVRTADGDPGFAATATQMSDGDRANGEIEVLDAND
ncbi:MAG: TadE/TadG family type IV pilus assembly protein, partial [Actinomycetes bacterium]